MLGVRILKFCRCAKFSNFLVYSNRCVFIYRSFYFCTYTNTREYHLRYQKGEREREEQNCVCALKNLIAVCCTRAQSRIVMVNERDFAAEQHAARRVVCSTFFFCFATKTAHSHGGAPMARRDIATGGNP